VLARADDPPADEESAPQADSAVAGAESPAAAPQEGANADMAAVAGVSGGFTLDAEPKIEDA
jgi:hypothetical protein